MPTPDNPPPTLLEIAAIVALILACVVIAVYGMAKGMGWG